MNSEARSTSDKERVELPTLLIPARIRSAVYLIGMIGFPAVVAAYVLVVLATDLKQIDRTLNALSTRIAERPMGVERSTDFVIYITDSLRSELMAGLPNLVAGLDLSTPEPLDKIALVRKVEVVSREIDAYIRPIVRRHQRFAERFPTVGGNIGAYFAVSAPSVDLSAGETEAHLRGDTSKNFGEVVSALWMNNFVQFGNVDLSAMLNHSNAMSAQLEGVLGIESLDRDGTEQLPQAATAKELIDPALFLKLAGDGVETATTVLRDQMLQKLKANATVRE